jgi:F420-dependent oxidoreductase-like protein
VTNTDPARAWAEAFRSVGAESRRRNGLDAPLPLWSWSMASRVPCFVFLPQAGFSYAALRESVRSAEALGFDGFWTVDHMWARGAPELPFLDGWGLVTGLAEATTRIRLGVLVTCNSYRNPGVLAKMVVTADHVSDGRIELGIGAGWMEEEYGAYGIHFPPIRTRLAQLEESLAIMASLFSKPRTTSVGAHYQFRDAPFEPKPMQRRLPITIGGSGTQVLMRLVAKYADRWNCPMPAAPRLREHMDALSRHCDQVKRDVREIVVSEQLAIVIAKDDEELRKRKAMAAQRIGGFVDLDTMAVVGTPQAVVDALAEKMKLGVRDFAILFGDLAEQDSFELFAERVAPHLTIP